MNATHVISLPINRYKTAEFDTVLPSGDYLYKLDQPVTGSTRAVIDRKYIETPEEAKSLTQIFLLNKTGVANWLAAPWVETQNPWTNGIIEDSVGTVIQGEIFQIVDENRALLRSTQLGVLLEFTVFINKLPEEFLINNHEPIRNIRDILFDGDQIAGILMQPDFGQLHLRLDVDAWYEQKLQQWRDFDPDDATDSDGSQIFDLSVQPELPLKAPDLKGLKIAVVDDDDIFAASICDSLEAAGATVYKVSFVPPGGMAETMFSVLRQSPDIILLDKQLQREPSSEVPIFESVVNYMARNPGAKVLLITGDIDQGPEMAVENKFGFAPKPVLVSEIFDWIENPQPLDPTTLDLVNWKSSKLFAIRKKTEQVIKLTNGVLETICKNHDLFGAFWVIRLNSGKYELRATSHSMENVFIDTDMKALTSSILSDALTSGVESNGKLSSNDPVSKALRRNGYENSKLWYFSLPLIFDDENLKKDSRVLVFLSKSRVLEATRQEISRRRDHFELLINTIDDAYAIDEISASAENGRMALGCLHEIRNLVSSMFAYADNPTMDEKHVIAGMKKYFFPKMRDLALLQLGAFSTSREEVFHVIKDLRQVLKNMTGFLRDSMGGRGVHIQATYDVSETLQLSIDPASIERAIVNLVFNAGHFLRDRKVKKLFVRVYRSEYDDLPIRIEIADSGVGISADDRPNLFMPRATTKTADEGGVGLGLFLSRRLIETIGGELIEIPQPRWGGAKFEIRLPELVG